MGPASRSRQMRVIGRLLHHRKAIEQRSIAQAARHLVVDQLHGARKTTAFTKVRYWSAGGLPVGAPSGPPPPPWVECGAGSEIGVFSVSTEPERGGRLTASNC